MYHLHIGTVYHSQTVGTACGGDYGWGFHLPKDTSTWTGPGNRTPIL